MILSINSPDKISIGLFLSFMRFYLGPTWKDYAIADTHSLMSVEDLNKFLGGVLGDKTNAIITYYARKQINKDPLTVIPQKILDLSDTAFWFDLYSTEYRVIKDLSGLDSKILVRWKANIQKMTLN